MSHEKIEKLEEHIYRHETLLWKIESTLENIEKAILWAVWINNIVITHQEKHKVSEKRHEKTDERLIKIQDSINWINLKIAMASWGWMVVMMIISKL